MQVEIISNILIIVGIKKFRKGNQPNLNKIYLMLWLQWWKNGLSLIRNIFKNYNCLMTYPKGKEKDFLKYIKSKNKN
jgi:hypothetical protein